MLLINFYECLKNIALSHLKKSFVNFANNILILFYNDKKNFLENKYLKCFQLTHNELRYTEDILLKQTNKEYYYNGIKLIKSSRLLWNIYLYIDSVLIW